MLLFKMMNKYVIPSKTVDTEIRIIENLCISKKYVMAVTMNNKIANNKIFKNRLSLKPKLFFRFLNEKPAL